MNTKSIMIKDKLVMNGKMLQIIMTHHIIIGIDVNKANNIHMKEHTIKNIIKDITNIK